MSTAAGNADLLGAAHCCQSHGPAVGGAEGLTDRALVLTETAPRRPPPLPPSWRDAISVPNARWRETFADPPPLVNTQKAEGAAPPSSGCGRGEGDRGAALLQPGG